jgi:hypothetical protein
MRKQTNVIASIPEIDTLILLDRQVDLVSPLFVQLTYEGLIDEIFGINNGTFKPDFELIVNDEPKLQVTLDSEDTIFSEIRDLNQSYVGKN